MKKYSFLFLSLIFVISIVGCSFIGSRSPDDTSQEIVDVIHWDGSTYIHTGVTVSGELIGNKLGVIKKKVSTKGANFELQDGDATDIEAGTMVYWVQQADHKIDMISVKINNQWILYKKMTE